MKKRSIALLAFSAMAFSASAGDVQHDYVTSSDGLRLVTVDDVRHVMPLLVDLAPTNAPVPGGVYALRCQVVYEDHAGRTARNDFVRIRATNDYLNELLAEFLQERVVGRDYAEMTDWCVGLLADGALELNAWFYERNVTDERLADVKIVLVQVEPSGNLWKDLAKEPLRKE